MDQKNLEQSPEEVLAEGREGRLRAEDFEAHRSHLRAVAYRMLGSLAEADDAVQETWLRASAADTSEVANTGGWLTTIATRTCLNVLRSRATRREEQLETAYGADRPDSRPSPEQEVEAADAVGIALLVVLDTLTPDERLAFVLHDLFAIPFDEIAAILERTPASARQLASRARRRVRGTTPAVPDSFRQQQAVSAFLAATRTGDFEALVALLHPDVVLTADPAVIPTPEPVVVLGAHTVAKGAMAATGRAQFTGPALLDGVLGLAMAPNGRLRLVLAFTVHPDSGLITAVEVIAEPQRLAALELAVGS
ncbi:sigma-70 family RNA polymerase sigma factor [Streptomyces sp. NPDC046853]|uniref:sigma-70 family RNA polymerase sigma factor n=1 Tax=Streptomyces sp. NPDC046853 TaxID=3154920 RepID=UPI003408FC17